MRSSRNLTSPFSSRSARVLTWARVVGTISMISYATASAYVGIAEQEIGRHRSEMDCDYRAKLLRDRVLDQMDRSRHAILRVPEGDPQLPTLLRETEAACVANSPTLARSLALIRETLRDHEAWTASHVDKARHELLAL